MSEVALLLLMLILLLLLRKSGGVRGKAAAEVGQTGLECANNVASLTTQQRQQYQYKQKGAKSGVDHLCQQWNALLLIELSQHIANVLFMIAQ